MSANYLTLGTVTLDQPSFQPVDLTPLLGRVSRGSNRLLPGAPGRRALANTREQIDVTITWHLDGRRNHAGTVTVGGTGIYDNLEFYKSAFFDQANATTGLTLGTLHLTNGTVQAGVQVWDWSPYWTGPLSADVATRIVVPAGEWT